MYNKITWIFFVSCYIINVSLAISFKGQTPPNSYIIPVNQGDTVWASADWSSNATDLDLHMYQPGVTISDQTSAVCQCFCCTSSQTVSLVANANGNVVVWAQQWGGAGVDYNITIKKNGATFMTDSTLLSQNGSYHKASISSTPCTMFVNFTSTGNFSLSFYSSNTLLSGSPLKTLSYSGGSGYKDMAIPLTINGTYDLKVIANPSSPAGGWNSFTYYKGTMQCQACRDFMVGCLTCSSSSVCTSCETGYTLTNGKCQCSVTNCETCFTATTCKQCQSPLYYLSSPTQCSTCQKALDYCIQCSSDAVLCTKCLDDHYFLLNDQCHKCSTSISNCVRCQDKFTCSQCDTNYHLNAGSANVACKLCEESMEGCLTCDSATSCTSVVNNTYFIYPLNKTVAKCSESMPHCATCSSHDICLSCETGYFLQNNQCLKCSQFMIHCLQCSNSSKCQVCDADFLAYQPTGNCTCKVGWYVPDACTTVLGCISAQKFDQNLSTCLMCDSDQHFIYDPVNKTCFCDAGFMLNNDEVCTQFCGDGVHVDEQCDDGNVLNNDGCSFNCNVEDNFICKGSTYEVSKCFINIKPQITYLYSIRTDGKNKGTHYFLIEPSSYLYSIVNFTDLVKIDDSRIIILQAQYSDGRIQIQFAYNQTVENEDFTVQWQLDKSFNSTNLKTKFQTKTMKPPLNIIEYQTFFEIVYWLGEILAYLLIGLMLSNVFYHKMIAIELIMVYQLIFITGSLSHNNISIYRVLTSLRPVLGISNILAGSKISLIDPQVLRFFSVGRALIYNMNISLIIYFVILIVFVVLGGMLFKDKFYLRRCNELTLKLQKKSQAKRNFKLQKQLSKMEEEKLRLRDIIFHCNRRLQVFYERLFFPISTFFLLPIFVMKSVHLMGSIKGESYLIENFSSVLLEIVFMASLLLFCYEVRKLFSTYKDMEYKLSFRSLIDCLNKEKYHKFTGIFLILGVICVLLTLLSIESDRKMTIITIPILTICFLLFLKTQRPYIQHFHNKVLLYNYSILLFHLIILFIDHYTKIPEIPLLCCLLVIFICGYIAVVLSLYRIYLESKEIERHNLNAENLKPEKRNYKDTLKFNPYIYRQGSQQNEEFPVPNINQKLPQNADKILSFVNKNLIQKEEDQNLSELQIIKRRLRKEIKSLQMSPKESLFIYDR